MVFEVWEKVFRRAEGLCIFVSGDPLPILLYPVFQCLAIHPTRLSIVLPNKVLRNTMRCCRIVSPQVEYLLTIPLWVVVACEQCCGGFVGIVGLCHHRLVLLCGTGVV